MAGTLVLLLTTLLCTSSQPGRGGAASGMTVASVAVAPLLPASDRLKNEFAGAEPVAYNQ